MIYIIKTAPKMGNGILVYSCIQSLKYANSSFCRVGNLLPTTVHRWMASNALPKRAKKFKRTGKNSTNAIARVPSSGFIGKTRFDILSPIFQKHLPEGIEMVSLLDQTIKTHDKLIENHGVVEGTSKWKAIWSYANGLLEGRDVDNPGWVSTGRVDKWPNKIGYLRPLYHFIIDNNDKDEVKHRVAELRRAMLTLSKLNRVCEANRTIDLTKSKMRFKLDPELVKRFEQYARTRLGEVREEISSTDISVSFYLSPNNGPNKLPMQESALIESAALRARQDLYKPFKDLCIATGNTEFLNFFTQCARRYAGLKDQIKNVKLRKVTSVPDKGNKSRIIALCEFWTQSVLKSLEDVVVKVTGKLFPNNCCFFSHNRGWSIIMDLPCEVQATLVSLDATEWTDNLPSALQYIVVKALFGQKIASAWKALAVDCEWFVPGFNRPFKYGKGQGMGTKGSFAIAQLTDLIFVEFILKEEYPNVASPFFMKVGDDLVVYDPKLLLSSRYEQIGVPINLTKSKFLTSYGSFIEFVSRNSWNGQDYSIISPTLIPRFTRNDFYSATLYQHLIERDVDIGSFENLLMLKNPDITDINLISDKSKDRYRKIIMIILLIGHMEDHHIANVENSPWNQLTNEELLDFLENWILSILGEWVHVIVSDYMKPESEAARSTILNLAQEHNLSPRGGFSINPSDLFFRKVIQNNLSLKEAIILQESSTLVDDINNRFDEGIKSIDLINTDVSRVFEDSVHVDSYVVRPQFLELLLGIVDKIGQMTTGYKTLRRLSYLDQANTKSVIHLHKHLYGVLSLKDAPLDLNTGIYSLPNGKETVKLDPATIDGFLTLFKFDGILREIRNARQALPESGTYVLHD